MAENALEQKRHQSSHISNASIYARLALGMTAFGSATPVSKIVTNAMPVFVGAGFRVDLGAVALAPFAFKNWKAARSLGRTGWSYTLLIALFGMFGFSTLMLYGMRMVSGVVGAIVMSTTPAVTAAAAMLLMGEKPTWRKIGAVVLAAAGVLILLVGARPEVGIIIRGPRALRLHWCTSCSRHDLPCGVLRVWDAN